MSDDKQAGEVRFWRRLFTDNGLETFLDIRRADLDGRTGWFPDLMAETGRGIDWGCGLVSIFEFCDLDMDACDPLLAEYDEIYRHDGTVHYVQAPEGPYEFVVCMNVIDHTPDIGSLLDAIEAVLVPGGRLYFEVNFDPELYVECHHTLWRMETVREHMSRFDLVRERVTSTTVFPEQQHYEAVYTRRP